MLITTNIFWVYNLPNFLLCIWINTHMYTHTYTVSLHIPCFRSMAGQTANLTDRWIDCVGVSSPNPFIHVVHISAVYVICSCLHIYCDILLDFIIYIFKWSFIIQNLGAFNTALKFFLSVFAKFSHIFSEHALTM